MMLAFISAPTVLVVGEDAWFAETRYIAVLGDVGVSDILVMKGSSSLLPIVYMPKCIHFRRRKAVLQGLREGKGGTPGKR
jgi:hypothetical protein